MIKRNNTAAAPDRPRWRTYFLITTCGLLTVSGFFFAGRQHFSWMDYGMKNSRLRKQIDDLQAEKRRLLLAREVSLSPTEIKKAAKKVGLGGIAETETTVAQVSAASKDKTTPMAAIAGGPVSAKPMIIKTAAVTAVPQPAAATYKKTYKSVKMVAKLTAAE